MTIEWLRMTSLQKMQKSLNPVFLFVLTVGLFLLTYLLLGFHFAWIDDVLMNNYLRGLLSSEPIDDFYLYQRGLSKVLSGLYFVVPQWPWYGLFLYACIFVATFNVFHFLSKVFLQFKINSRLHRALLLTLFFLVAWIENVYLINFTRVSILLTGSSLLGLIYLIYFEKDVRFFRLKYGFYLGAFGVGYLLRPEATTFTLVILGGLVALLSFSRDFRKPALFVLPLLLFIGTHTVVEKTSQSADKAKFETRWPYIFNLLDGCNFKSEATGEMLKTPEDSVRLMAVGTWYVEDENQITPEFLEQLSASSPISWTTLSNWRQNLNDEFHKAKSFYGREYHRGLNWFVKMIGFAIFNLLILLWCLSQLVTGEMSTRSFLKVILYFFGFVALMLTTMLFIKMEDRIFTPVAIIFTCGNLLLLTSLVDLKLKGNRAKRGLIVLLILLAGFSIWRMKSMRKIAVEKKQELNLKRNFIAEVNTQFSDKLIFYDLWSMTLLHDSPFKNVEMNPQNTHTVFGEYWCNSYQSHRDYLKSICGSVEFEPFFECLFEKKEEVVFILSKHRKDLLESYLSILYNLNYKFELIHPDSEVSKIKYSFLWAKLDFNYYRLRQ
jgi:hypothetical protein